MCRRHVHKWRMFSFRTGEYPQRTMISISLRPLNSKDSGWSGWPCKVTSGLANIGAFWDTLSTKAIPLEPVKTNGIPRLNHHSLPISALDLNQASGEFSGKRTWKLDSSLFLQWAPLHLVLKMKLCAPTLSQVLKKASWVHHGLVHHFELVQDLGQPI